MCFLNCPEYTPIFIRVNTPFYDKKLIYRKLSKQQKIHTLVRIWILCYRFLEWLSVASTGIHTDVHTPIVYGYTIVLHRRIAQRLVLAIRSFLVPYLFHEVLLTVVLRWINRRLLRPCVLNYRFRVVHIYVDFFATTYYALSFTVVLYHSLALISLGCCAVFTAIAITIQSSGMYVARTSFDCVCSRHAILAAL
jgi:hypothetical protein